MNAYRIGRTAQKALKLAQILAVPAYRRAMRHGTAASVEHHRLGFPPDTRCVLDVGANRGQFALLARHLFPAARIYCFEPLPQPRSKIKQLFAADSGVIVLPHVLGAERGTAEFHVSHADDSSSLLRPTEIQTSAHPDSRTVQSTPMPVTTLDAAVAELRIDRPALLKLDVQGAELDVLRGGELTLQTVDHLFVECSFCELYAGQGSIDDVIAFLRERGFCITGSGVPSHGPSGETLQIDLLFGRQRHPPGYVRPLVS